MDELVDFIDNPAVLEEYGQLLSRYKVGRFLPEDPTHGGKRGFHSGTEGRQFIGLRSDLSNEDVVSTLVHEIQHAIQRHEGFVGGANWTKMMNSDQAMDAEMAMAGAKDVIENFQAFGKASATNAKQLAGNQVIGAAMARMLRGDSAEEVTKWAQGLMDQGMKTGTKTAEEVALYAGKAADMVRRNLWDSDKIAEFTLAFSKEAQQFENVIIPAKIKYYQNAGEAEARLAQKRIDMPEGARWMIEPYDQLDVPKLTDEKGNYL